MIVFIKYVFHTVVCIIQKKDVQIDNEKVKSRRI